MPPRGHSGSSHGGSFSRRSSSFRSSRGPSRPPGRSGGFGSSGKRPSSHSRTTRTGTFSTPRVQPPAPRPRRNQPSGFVPMAAYMTLRHLYGRSHDYVYYPNGWTAADGRVYEGGYYDEDGNRYGNVVIENEETVLTCEYCGSQTKVVWKEGLAPTCENCGAPLKIDLEDKPQEGTQAAGNDGAVNVTRAGRRSPLTIIIAVLVVIGLLRTCSALMASSDDSSGAYYGPYEDEEYIDADETSSIYVEEIGRTCYLDGEDYYDPDTECWFYFNEDAGVWQYWYEGISSDYGDYGWMEYDYGEDKWYIEKDYGNWIELPSRYTEQFDYLWHFSE